MNIVSIDLELNKPTNTIISLGYIIANVKNKKIVVAKNLFIKPINCFGFAEQIDPCIRDLTGITQGMINNGIHITDAYQELCGDLNRHQVNKHPLQWGLDHYELRKQLNFQWEEFIFRPRAHDIKSLYQLYQMTMANGKTVAGLGRALTQLGLNWDNTYGSQHNSLADAHNTLLLYFHISDKMKKYTEVERIVNGKKHHTS